MIKLFEGESEGVSKNLGFSIPLELNHLWGDDIFRFVLLWLTKAWPDFVLQFPSPAPIFPTHPPQKMELGSRALDQNVYSIRCWRWKLPKFRLCPKREWFTFGQFSVLSKGLTQYHSTFYEFQASHLQWYFSSEGILASARSRIHIWKGRVGVFWEPIAYKGNAKNKQTYNRTWHQRVNRWAQMMCPRKVKYFRRKGWFQRAT